MQPIPFPTRIISGGQTGVDQAALSVAISLGIAHGGWCPSDRRCEGGEIPLHFSLTPMPTPSYAARTRQNIIDSDATLILHRGPLTGGTLLTHNIVRKLSRPLLEVELDDHRVVEKVRRWLQENAISTLNVAGPRESNSPGIYEGARCVLSAILDRANA